MKNCKGVCNLPSITQLACVGLKFQSWESLPLELSLNHWTMLLSPSAYMTSWFTHHKRYGYVWEAGSEFRDSMRFCFTAPVVATAHGKRVRVPVSFGFPGRQTCAWILTPLPPSCVTLGKSHNSISNQQLIGYFLYASPCAKCLAYVVSLN